MKKIENSQFLASAMCALILVGVFSGCIGQKEESAPLASLTVTPPVQPAQESPPPPSIVIQLVEKADLPNDQGPVYSQDWSPDGRLLAAAGFSQVKVWSIEDSGKAVTLEGHTSYVWGVAWSPDGSTLASASQDGTVRFWSSPAHAESAVLETGWAFCLDWSPDGSQLVVGTSSGGVQMWDVSKRELLHMWKNSASSSIICIAWSPDGKVIASGEWSGAISLWDAGSGHLLKTLVAYTEARCDVNGLAWSPDGTVLASAHQDGHVRLWSVQGWQLAQTIDAHTGWSRGVAWSPDGRLLASTGEDKRACFWDRETGQLVDEVSHNFLPVWSVAWSPDGMLVSTGSGAYSESRPGVALVWMVLKQGSMVW